MSITRSQIARQLLAEGGAPRKGFRNGGVDEADVEAGLATQTMSDFSPSEGGTGTGAVDTGGLGSEEANVAATLSAINNLGTGGKDEGGFLSKIPTPINLINKFVGPFRDRTNLARRTAYLNKIGYSNQFSPEFIQTPLGLETLKNLGYTTIQDVINKNEDEDSEPIRKIRAPITEAKKEERKGEFDDILKYYGAKFEDGGEVRQEYGLGDIVKKATRAVKKVAKSPIGKAALFAGLGAYGLGAGPFASGGAFAKAKGAGFLKNFLLKDAAAGFALDNISPFGAITAASLLAGGLSKQDEEDETLPQVTRSDPEFQKYLSFYGGPRRFARSGGIMTMLGKAGSAVKNLKNNIITKLSRMTDDVEIQTTYDDAIDTGPSMDTMITAKSRKGKKVLDQLVEEGVAEVDDGVYYIKEFDEAMMGLEEGGIKASGAKLGTDEFRPISDFESGLYESMEEKMIRNLNKKAGGGMMEQDEMLNLGGNEMDLRGGGFVPLGEYEKKDDVPARLSKNEFVMTADAVRAAGGGSVDRGADIMYKTMKTLENKVA